MLVSQRVNYTMSKVLHIPLDRHWDIVTNLLHTVGVRYVSSREEPGRSISYNTLAFNREHMWLVSKADNPDLVTINQAVIDELTLLQHSPEAVIEWLLNK